MATSYSDLAAQLGGEVGAQQGLRPGEFGQLRSAGRQSYRDILRRYLELRRARQQQEQAQGLSGILQLVAMLKSRQAPQSSAVPSGLGDMISQQGGYQPSGGLELPSMYYPRGSQGIG